MRPWDYELSKFRRDVPGFDQYLEDLLMFFTRETSFSRAFVYRTLRGLTAHLYDQLGETNWERWLAIAAIDLTTLVPFLAGGKVIIRPEAALARQLMHTRLTVPLSMIKPPFPAIYVDLLELNYRNVRLPASYGNCNKLTGVYLTDNFDCFNYQPKEDHGVSPFGMTRLKSGENERCIGLRFLTDEGYQHAVYVPAINMASDEPFEEFADTITAKSDLSSQAARLGPAPDTMPEDIKPLLRLTCGLCLYMSHPELRQNVTFKMHHRQEQMKRNMAKGFVDEDMRQLLHGSAGSTIKVKGTKADGKSGGEGLGNSPSSHWRRGHWHLYWTGAGRQVEKYNWIKPILVNPEGMTGEVAPKTYKVE